MQRIKYLLALLLLTAVGSVAAADAQEVRHCAFEVKARCASGEARVTLAAGAVQRLQVDVFWCGLRGRPGYTCTIEASRGDQDSKWSDDGGTTLIANASPFNPDRPDRVKVTVGKSVSVDLNETQSLGRCGAGAELPQSIVIPPHGKCRVQLAKPGR